MQFDYKRNIVLSESINIEDIGEFAIECSNEDGFYYYMITTTYLGYTHILTFGPIIPDMEKTPSGYSTYYKCISFKEETLIKDINKFITDTKKNISKITVVTKREAFSCLKDFSDIILKVLC